MQILRSVSKYVWKTNKENQMRFFILFIIQYLCGNEKQKGNVFIKLEKDEEKYENVFFCMF